MNPVIKPLAWALLGGGLALVTTAGAIDLPWLHKPVPTAVAPVAAAVSALALPSPAPRQ